MRRGEIYYADLTPTVGSEINKRRPVLIVSNDANNRVASTLTVLPITSNVSRVYPFELLLAPKESGLPKPSKAQAQQIRTISKERVRGAPWVGLMSRLCARQKTLCAFTSTSDVRK
jgi:mRNA interferase MazF